MIRYDPVEKANGALFTADVPVNLTSRAGQMRIKDFLWRITEEIAEVYDARTDEDRREEVIDVLHFVVELCILAGVDIEEPFRQFMFHMKFDRLEALYWIVFPDWYTDFKKDNDTLEDPPFEKLGAVILGGKVTRSQFEHSLWQIVWTCGKVGHLLKNRPWKEKTVDADVPLIRQVCLEVLYAHIRLMGQLLITPQQAYELYVGKHAVNNQRLDKHV